MKLLEVNCRFQASSALVNRALAEQGFPSLQEINLAAWKDGEKAANYAKYLDGLRVEYSNYSYNYTGDETHALHVFNAVNAAKKAESGEGVLLGYQSKALSGKLCFPEADGYRPLPRELCKLDDNAHFYRTRVPHQHLLGERGRRPSIWTNACASRWRNSRKRSARSPRAEKFPPSPCWR